MKRLVPPLLLALLATLAACGGDSVASPGRDSAGADASPTATAAPGWSLTPEQLCALLTAEEASAATGQEVALLTSPLDGCHYTGATVNARLTETVFSAAEYQAIMPQLGASWVNQIEADSIVLAYTSEGLVMDAWFTAADARLNLTLGDGLGESVVLAIIAAARAVS